MDNDCVDVEDDSDVDGETFCLKLFETIVNMYIRLTPKKKLISASSFGTEFRMGKTRPCEFFQIYRPISFIWQTI